MKAKSEYEQFTKLPFLFNKKRICVNNLFISPIELCQYVDKLDKEASGGSFHEPFVMSESLMKFFLVLNQDFYNGGHYRESRYYKIGNLLVRYHAGGKMSEQLNIYYIDSQRELFIPLERYSIGRYRANLGSISPVDFLPFTQKPSWGNTGLISLTPYMYYLIQLDAFDPVKEVLFDIAMGKKTPSEYDVAKEKVITHAFQAYFVSYAFQYIYGNGKASSLRFYHEFESNSYHNQTLSNDDVYKIVTQCLKQLNRTKVMNPQQISELVSEALHLDLTEHVSQIYFSLVKLINRTFKPSLYQSAAEEDGPSLRYQKTDVGIPLIHGLIIEGFQPGVLYDYIDNTSPRPHRLARLLDSLRDQCDLEEILRQCSLLNTDVEHSQNASTLAHQRFFPRDHVDDVGMKGEENKESVTRYVG